MWASSRSSTSADGCTSSPLPSPIRRSRGPGSRSSTPTRCASWMRLHTVRRGNWSSSPARRAGSRWSFGNVRIGVSTTRQRAVSPYRSSKSEAPTPTVTVNPSAGTSGPSTPESVGGAPIPASGGVPPAVRNRIRSVRVRNRSVSSPRSAASRSSATSAAYGCAGGDASLVRPVERHHRVPCRGCGRRATVVRAGQSRAHARADRDARPAPSAPRRNARRPVPRRTGAGPAGSGCGSGRCCLAPCWSGHLLGRCWFDCQSGTVMTFSLPRRSPRSAPAVRAVDRCRRPTAAAQPGRARRPDQPPSERRPAASASRVRSQPSVTRGQSG